MIASDPRRPEAIHFMGVVADGINSLIEAEYKGRLECAWFRLAVLYSQMYLRVDFPCRGMYFVDSSSKPVGLIVYNNPVI